MALSPSMSGRYSDPPTDAFTAVSILSVRPHVGRSSMTEKEQGWRRSIMTFYRKMIVKCEDGAAGYPE